MLLCGAKAQPSNHMVGFSGLVFFILTDLISINLGIVPRAYKDEQRLLFGSSKDLEALPRNEQQRPVRFFIQSNSGCKIASDNYILWSDQLATFKEISQYASAMSGKLP